MRTVAIVGANITEEELLDKLKDDWEVWSLNNLYNQFPNINFTKWFELHDFKRVKNVYTRRGMMHYPPNSTIKIRRYMQQIDELDIPVMMQKKWKLIRKSELFPFKEIIKMYGSYFGCSFAWMIAYILYLNYQNLNADDRYGCIRFYGVGLSGHEYYYQRPSTEYMVGIAVGRGIEIEIDPSSTILKEPYIYAYKEEYEVIDFLHVGFMRDISTSVTLAITRFFMDKVL